MRKGVAAADVAGSGRGGRVTKEDALLLHRSRCPGFSGCQAGRCNCRRPAVAVNLGDRTEQRVPMTRLRARIAERLLQSQRPTPS
jgi:2-oxoglutarate dehydrogenase E2 component (dihydrolipoamide succinyltransferase)